MSIKQGEFLKELRAKNNYSQEKLGEILGVSRQSVSKWEQGYAIPDTENLMKLSKLYGVSVDSILNCQLKEEIVKEDNVNVSVLPNDDIAQSKQKNSLRNSKFSWFFWSYPFLVIIIYISLGLVMGTEGWSTGWLAFLTIPVYYSAVFSLKRKNPLLFAYPVVAAIIFLIFGLFFSLWHPAWIVFLTIPIYYVIAFVKRKAK